MKARLRLLMTLLLACLCLYGCAKAPAERDQKLIDYFTGIGLSCERAKDAEIVNPAIYKASAWYALLVDGEEVYVYFDESNRADYMCEGIDADEYGYATSLGLRYVLNYRGDNEKVLDALREMGED